MWPVALKCMKCAIKNEDKVSLKMAAGYHFLLIKYVRAFHI